MSEKQFGWNYFENEVVIRDKQDKKRMIVLVFSNFICIPYNRKSFDELVDWLNEQQDTIEKQKRIIKSQDDEISRQYNLCLAMSGVLREEFGVYDVFDRTKDKKIGGQQSLIGRLQEENLYKNFELKSVDDLKKLKDIFEICMILIDGAIADEDLELGYESVFQFERRIKKFNGD